MFTAATIFNLKFMTIPFSLGFFFLLLSRRMTVVENLKAHLTSNNMLFPSSGAVKACPSNHRVFHLFSYYLSITFHN